MILKLTDPAEIVRSMWHAYAGRDIEGTLLYVSPDVAFAIFIPVDIVPFGGGETIGKAALSERLHMVLDQFDTLNYDGTVLGVSGGTVRGHVEFSFRHKRAGEVIQGVMRQVFDVKDGKITRLHEFHDVERLRAFMKLVSFRVKD
jgi:ketosteroid isomerase-like protein